MAISNDQARLFAGGDEALAIRLNAADTKEQLAGCFFVEVPSLDEAIVWAKRCPSSKYGSIEIRPIVEKTAAK